MLMWFNGVQQLVHLVMILSAMLGLRHRHVDYTQAFTQADLEVPVYREIHSRQGC
jgi:hypothetical protein